MRSDVKAVSTHRRKVFLALTVGPLLGALVFFAVVSRNGAPSAIPDSGHVYVPWHKSTRLTAVELKWISPGTVDVLTRRDGKIGTTYVLRRIDCTAREFQYLGEGTTEQQARAGQKGETAKNRLADGSISFYVAAHACPGWKTK